ncbi:pre-rRNA 2'-O-ribose RNA methyltransferase FTSJ3-like [Ptychodera flava]|uniref:pre-rRNA 2'-O-ribose RNA methyltransferase FTSJ3-like n=1 Tax=Ptychodera flava TaxID=63121 RepID=UPI00396A4FD9
MGKKIKTGKRRKDKFYMLAKETGYRARSAFKLLQLNRKFQFLQKSRVLIDLCAAPGGWLQVASNHMPMSSIIVGVDLVPIKAIPNVITFEADITTEKCRLRLQKELQKWKADVVLNDGAPNVGKNWIHDAFSQASLTLKALKLASEFLNKGGWFVTKVFRSKDYQPLMWVFKQLFNRVHATKPQASRSESAEIFVVCQGYFAPDKIDARFFDMAHIFKEVSADPKPVTVLAPEKQKKKAAEGYAEGDYTLYHTKTVTEFLQSETPLDILSSCNELKLDSKAIANHNLTTSEIKHCFSDIKVLGKRDIRNLMRWREKMLQILQKLEPAEDKEGEKKESESEDEDEKIQEELTKLKDEEKADVKRKKKQLLKKKKKLRERLALKMDLPGDTPDFGTDESVFSLSNIKSKHQLAEVNKGDISFMDEDEEDDEDEEPEKELEFESDDENGPLNEYDTPGKESDEGDDEDIVEDNKIDGDDDDDDDDDDDAGDEEGEEEEEDDESEDDISDGEENPLMVDLEDKTTKAARQTRMWFNKESFSGIEVDEDEDMEIEAMTELYKDKGGIVMEKSKKEKKEKSGDKHVSFNESVTSVDGAGKVDKESLNESDSDEEMNNVDQVTDSDDSDSDSESGSDYDDIVMMNGVSRPVQQGQKGAKRKVGEGDDDKGFEVVPIQEPAKKIKKLSPEGLALGALMVSSKKNKRNIIEQAFNRNTFNDTNLPDWFAADEAKHTQRHLPITKEMVAEYRERLREINARPIKKVAEAKARKKRKSLKRLEKARKKAEEISSTVDMGDREKAHQIKSLYKKAGLLNKKKLDKQYVVTKKSLSSKRMRRPSGVKGPYKVVDQRMKKDVRAKLKKEAKKKKGRRR